MASGYFYFYTNCIPIMIFLSILRNCIKNGNKSKLPQRKSYNILGDTKTKNQKSKNVNKHIKHTNLN